MSDTTKRFNRRQFVAGAAALSAAAVLAACGSDAATAVPAATAAPTKAPAAAATTAPAAAATTAPAAAATTAPAAAATTAPATGGTAATTAPAAPAANSAKAVGAINYWHHFTSDTEMTGMERVIAGFKTKYPMVTLTQENIPNANFMQKVTAATQAKTLPDTLMISADRVNDMVAMGAVRDLSDRITAAGMRKNFPDNRWQAGTVNGKTYGVPAFMFVNWVYYRMDYFKDAGITAPPKTWAEFGDMAIKLTDPSKNRYGFGLRGGDGGEGWISTLMRAWGSPIVDDKGKPAIDIAKTTDAIKFYTDLFTKSKAAPPSAPNDSYAQIMTAFKTGQTAMVMHHTGSLKEVRDVLGDKIGTFPLPAGPVTRITDVTPQYNGISTGTKDDKLEAAWAWVSQWTEVDAEVALLQETGYFPANTAAGMDAKVTGDKIYAAASESLGYGTIAPQFVGNAGWQKQTVLPAFQKVLLGQSTPAQCAEEMAAGLKKATA